MLLALAPLVAAVTVVVAPIGPTNATGPAGAAGAAGKTTAPLDLPAFAAGHVVDGVVTRAAAAPLSLSCLQEPACRVGALGDADAVLRADVDDSGPEPSLRLTLHRKDGVVVGDQRVSGRRELLPAALAPVVVALLKTASTVTTAPPATTGGANEGGAVAGSAVAGSADKGSADDGIGWPVIVAGVCAGSCAVCAVTSAGLVVFATLAEESDTGNSSSSGCCTSSDIDCDLGIGDALGDSCDGLGDGLGSLGSACDGIGDIGSCAAPAPRGPLAPASSSSPSSPTFLLPPPAEDAARTGEMPW